MHQDQRTTDLPRNENSAKSQLKGRGMHSFQNITVIIANRNYSTRLESMKETAPSSEQEDIDEGQVTAVEDGDDEFGMELPAKCPRGATQETLQNR